MRTPRISKFEPSELGASCALLKQKDRREAVFLFVQPRWSVALGNTQDNRSDDEKQRAALSKAKAKAKGLAKALDGD
jgi:hypothetical protein